MYLTNIFNYNDILLILKYIIEPPHDKTIKMTVRPAKTQISLGIRPICSESSLCAQWIAKDPSFLHADSEDSDQTGRMPRLICVFAGRTVILLVLSWGGSFEVPVPFMNRKRVVQTTERACNFGIVDLNHLLRPYICTSSTVCCLKCF